MEDFVVDKEEFYFKINNVFLYDFFFLEKEKNTQHHFTWELHESKKNKITWELESYGYKNFRKSLNVTRTRCPEIDKNVKKHMKQKLKEKQKEFQQLSKKHGIQIKSYRQNIFLQKKEVHTYSSQYKLNFLFFQNLLNFGYEIKKRVNGNLCLVMI